MLDIRRIRSHAEQVKEGMERRHMPEAAQAVDKVLELDERRREILGVVEEKKANQNKMSRQIPQMKKAGEDTTELMANLKELSDAIKEYDEELAHVESQSKEYMFEIPNVPHESVPMGETDEDNVEVRRYGEPKEFAYEPVPHWDLGADLDILDPEAAARVTGSRFHFYKGLGARLERSVISFFLNQHTDNGYLEILPPFMANGASMTGTGQLPKFADDMFKLEGLDYYMIPTAEVPITNMMRGEILDGSTLPHYYCGYSPCFRKEGGSAGRDTRGLIRQHQFQKVELVKYVAPENSYEELEKLTADAEKMLQLLEIPYRIVNLSTGDLGFSAAKTYDIEVWMPSYNHYVEISSCSNFEDFQARRANVRFRRTPDDRPEFVHTLNGSGLAVGRTVAAIMENYQNEDGSITVPQVLIPYMGTDRIEKR